MIKVYNILFDPSICCNMIITQALANTSITSCNYHIFLVKTIKIDLMVCWPRSLSSKWKSALTRRHSNDSIELEGKTAAPPLWAPRASKQAKKGVAVLAGVIDFDYQGELDHCFTMEVRKGMSEVEAIS